MFKKVILIVTLFLIIIVLSASREETALVYNQITNNNNYQLLYLSFENKTLNTNNFEVFFKDFQVLKVYPYINPIYAGRIKANYNYTFTHENHNYDLERFKNNYLEKLRNIGLINEANQYQSKGVIINKVLVYSSLDEVSEKLKGYNYIKYSSSLSGVYRKIV